LYPSRVKTSGSFEKWCTHAKKKREDKEVKKQPTGEGRKRKKEKKARKLLSVKNGTWRRNGLRKSHTS